MQKFTAFTVILTILTVVVVSEVVVNEYLPRMEEQEVIGDNSDLALPEDLDLTNTIATNVLGADLEMGDYLTDDLEGGTTIHFDDSSEKIERQLPEIEEEPLQPEAVEVDPIDSEVNDFEDSGAQTYYSPNVYLREEQVRSAGFANAYLQEEQDDGKLFKTIALSDIEGLEMLKSVVRTDQEMLAKVYVLKPGINLEVGDLYDLLKGRAAQGLNSEVNETNQFGQASFYLNDLSRENTAFLTARVGGLVYAFSYPKQYHSQIKNLIQLIEWELS